MMIWQALRFLHLTEDFYLPVHHMPLHQLVHVARSIHLSGLCGVLPICNLERHFQAHDGYPLCETLWGERSAKAMPSNCLLCTRTFDCPPLVYVPCLR